MDKKEYLHQYYLKNRDKIREKQKEYRSEHKDKSKEYSKEYYIKHREEIKSRSAEWKKNNKERAYETWKLYYDNNKETIVNRSRQWYAENKEKSSETKSKYRNTPMGRACKLYWKYNQMDINAGRGLGDLSPIWIVENIFTKPCVHCGKEGWKVIGCNRLDNSKPHTMDNVEPCCYECNVKLAGAERTQKKNSNRTHGSI